MKKLSISSLFVFCVFSLNAQVWECTHKQTEWSEWLQRQTLITVDEPNMTIKVQEVENAYMIIHYDSKMVIPPANNTFYYWKGAVVLALPPEDTRQIITVYTNNYLCPKKTTQ